MGARIEYRSEGRKILSDVDALYLRYIFRNEVEGSWDTMLVHGVSLMMKAAMAYPITKSTCARDAIAERCTQLSEDLPRGRWPGRSARDLGDFRLLAARGSDPSSWKW
jgi:hypothetical protein